MRYQIYYILYRYNIPISSNLETMEHYNVDNIVTNILTILYYNINTYIVTSKGYCNITVYEYNINKDIVTQ